MSNLQLEVYKDLTPALQIQWQNLWENAINAHSFNSPLWWLTCMRTYTYKDRYLVFAKKNQILSAILPLVKKHVFGVQALTSPGGKYLDKSTLVLKDPGTINLAEVIVRFGLKENIYLQEVDEKVLTLNGAEYSKRESSKNPFLVLKPDPFRYFSKRQQRKIKITLNHIKNDIVYKTFTANREALETAFMIDKNSVKREAGRAAFPAKQDEDFFRNLLSAFRNQVVIDILYLKNVPIIFYLGLVYKKTYHAYSTSYVSGYKYLVPGKLMLYYLIKRLVQEGYETLDFSRGRDRLKMDFTPNYTTQYDCLVSPNIAITKIWETANKTRERIVETPWLYNPYCTLKKLLI